MRLNDAMSPKRTATADVEQESIISPLLYNIYVRDIPSAEPQG